MLSVVCWKWRPAPGYRSKFGPETVNVLRHMVRRHYARPHRFICVTDDPEGIDPDVEIIPLWDDHSRLVNPFGPANPSCYRRLKMFSAEIEPLFGKRFVSLDLDCVITGDLAPLWDRPEDFVAWGDTNPSTHYNGSMMMLTAGARPQVWKDFHPERSPRIARAAGQFGSDQAWISHRLGPGEATWGTADGVYSYRNHLCRPVRPLPANARVVFFHGHTDPWSPAALRIGWVRRNYMGRAPMLIDVEAINLNARTALLTDGRTIPVTKLFDAEGAETADPAAALAFMAGEGRTWFSGAVGDYEPQGTQ